MKENKYFKNENASQLLKNTDQIQKHFLINNLVLYSFMVMFLYKGQPFKRAYHSSYITYLYHEFDRSPSSGKRDSFGDNEIALNMPNYSRIQSDRRLWTQYCPPISLAYTNSEFPAQAPS